MEQHITDMLEHMAKSHEELARILEAGRDIAVHLAHVIEAIPDRGMTFLEEGREGLAEQVMEVNGSVAAYLNSIGDLEEAIGENLKHVMKQLTELPDEE
jgi:phage shock protein A